ncbi:MAG: DNA polymerase III subunit alpha [Candidatus Omnitrophica bacterium]|nr:DNA polymerase III subunit alpha [Candidatus Omnitrophota bacterium]MBU4488766.1 DNA polymerase III subunit alpha [Candidatus Omnitrophota bacterium]MCG2705863.1 DNA polymerase III subunit alpha [Candidatus Omnitrophota bacterium]
MKHSEFVHLHVHTQYSLLDGACLIPKLLEAAKTERMPALAITDHGNMFGAIEFYVQALGHGIKPLIGSEVYIAPDSRFEKSAHGIQEASFHLLLLAKDMEGYKNLMKLITAGYLEGFYYRPRIDKELLSQHSKGLVCLSACLKGEIPHLIKSQQIEQARNTAIFFKEIFGKDFYLELQDNLIKEQYTVNAALLEFSRQLDIPVVATNDVHYVKKEHARAHEALLALQTQTTLDDPGRMRMQTDEFYLKSPQEMARKFQTECPEALKNTLVVAEKCNLELDFKKTHLPHYKVPAGKKREEYLRELVWEGITKRYPAITDEIKTRIEHELSIIEKSGYTSYFLIAWDFVHYAKEKSIPVGPGRGSAAGSIVSYGLGITDIDPLKYDLLFERFLNPERVSLPDIDIDFCYEQRNEVIKYVVEKYSKDNVAQIITFGTMMAKGVIRDVGRVMGLAYNEVDKIAKMVPNDLNITLTQALKSSPELNSLYKTDPRVTQLIDISLALEGLTRHASTHAAGVVICEKPLTEFIPLFKMGEGQITTGYPMTSLEKIGLLKMDFLGLRTLTVIDEALKIIKKIRNIDIDIAAIPLDDEATYRLLANANSAGVFQLESSGMRDLLRKFNPEKFEDLIAILALFRPGPMGSGMLDDFIERKHGKIEIKYDHPSLEPILKDTYGIIVFQEQVMRIASTLAGFTLAQADSLRRAMSKKTPEIMTETRKHFLDGCVKKGINARTADKIFNLIEYFAGYGFNKSHSAAYAMISYRTAYLKANYPVEFMTALLTSEKDNTDKIALYIDEAERLGIKVLPPDVNESFSKFTVVSDKSPDQKYDKAICFGLSAVKNAGHHAIDSIITMREKEGEFKSLYHFCEHIDSRAVNRKVIESLIKCGAFDSFKLHRSQLVAILDKAMEVAGGIQKDRQNGQFSFFDTFENEDNFKKSFQDIPDIKEWPESQLLAFEKEMLGFYITKHPLARFEKILRIYGNANVMSLGTKRDGENIFIGGILNTVKLTTTKKTGERMAIAKLEDLTGIVEVLVFPRSYTKIGKHIKADNMLFINGRLSLREEEPKIIAEEATPIEEVQEKKTKALSIKLITSGLNKKALESLKLILSNHKGEIPAYIHFQTPANKRVALAIGADFRVKPSAELINEIEELLGAGSVSAQSA